MSAWLICYDISDARALRRVHRQLQAHAMPLQYSVFYLKGSETALAHCLNVVVQLMGADDDVRCYPLPSHGQHDRLGCPLLPDGIQWTGLPAESETARQ